MHSGRRCRKSATTELNGTSPGPTTNLKAIGLCGKLKNTVEKRWQKPMIVGRNCNGNEQEKFVRTSQYSARLLSLQTSSKVALAIATSLQPWHRLPRGLFVCTRCSITAKMLRVAIWSNSTSTVFRQESWLMISFCVMGQICSLRDAKVTSFGLH